MLRYEIFSFTCTWHGPTLSDLLLALAWGWGGVRWGADDDDDDDDDGGDDDDDGWFGSHKRADFGVTSETLPFLGLKFKQLLTRCAKNIFNLRLCASILVPLRASILVPQCASVLGVLCGWVSIKFEVFHRGFSSYRPQGSNLVFLWPRWRNNLQIEGHRRAIFLQTLTWYLFNLRWVSHKFYEEIRVSETLCQMRAC